MSWSKKRSSTKDLKCWHVIYSYFWSLFYFGLRNYFGNSFKLFRTLYLYNHDTFLTFDKRDVNDRHIDQQLNTPFFPLMSLFILKKRSIQRNWKCKENSSPATSGNLTTWSNVLPRLHMKPNMWGKKNRWRHWKINFWNKKLYYQTD